ncbi:MAG TPA: ACT domain-containing protein, partial [Nitrososphaera sp.]
RNFRLITLDVELPWNVVGYFAKVSQILAEAGISLGALSSFSRDHILVKQDDLGKALRVLGEYVGELC